MITASSPWRNLGNVTPAFWRTRLVSVQSPIAAEWQATYEAAHPHTVLALAMLEVESRYATRFNANIPENKNPLNLRPPNGDGYLAFASYADAIQAWRDRITSPTYKGGIYDKTDTILELIERYAPANDSNDPSAYAAIVAARASTWITDAAPSEHNDGGNAHVSDLRIILNPGHRNTTGGNTEEAAWTPYLANAYFDAFSAAGFEAINLGDTDGGLDATCRRMAQAIASAPGECLLLDLHYEGSPVPGVFAIVPDVTGLTTGASVAQDPLDTWDHNAKDQQVGGAIVRMIAAATGLRARSSGVREPGLMDESQTGVGADGYRLATFAYTSPYRERAVRLVVEHGNHTIDPDRAIMLALGPTSGFARACAIAAVSAVESVYGPAKPPQPKPPIYATPELPDWWAESVGQSWPSDARDGDLTYRVCRRRAEALKPAVRRSQPSTLAPKSGPNVQVHEKINVERVVRVGRADWLVTADGHYVAAASFTPRIQVTPR